MNTSLRADGHPRCTSRRSWSTVSVRPAASPLPKASRILGSKLQQTSKIGFTQPCGEEGPWAAADRMNRAIARRSSSIVVTPDLGCPRRRSLVRLPLAPASRGQLRSAPASAPASGGPKTPRTRRRHRPSWQQGSRRFRSKRDIEELRWVQKGVQSSVSRLLSSKRKALLCRAFLSSGGRI
jgi:hypothetical protein